MRFDYICPKCGHKGVFIELSYWVDKSYRCPICFEKVNINSNKEISQTIIKKLLKPEAVVAIIIDGFYIAGVQQHCIQLAQIFKRAGFQIMIISMEAGGAWYKKFVDIADYLFVPSLKLPVFWKEIEDIFGSNIIERIKLCSCHLVNPIEWGIIEIPRHIKLFAHFHSEPSEHEVVDPMLLKRLNYRAERIFFPAHYTLNKYMTLHELDKTKCQVLHNGLIEPANFQQKIYVRNKDADIRIAVVSRIDCDKFSITLFERTVRLMIERGIHFKIIIAGSGDIMHLLRAFVEKMKIKDCIKLVGFLDDPSSLYEWADIVFLPSKRESMPYVMIESIRYQRPIVLPLVGIVADNIKILGIFSFESDNENDVVEKIILANHFVKEESNRNNMLITYCELEKKWEDEVKAAYDIG